MKIVQSVLLALTFFGPAVISSSAQAQSYDCFDPANDNEIAVCNLLGSANDALFKLNDLDLNTDVLAAKRHTRAIILGSDNLAKLLAESASDDAIVDQLTQLKNSMLQLDAAKRKLDRRYGSDKDELIKTLTYVRTAYYHLEGLLLSAGE